MARIFWVTCPKCRGRFYCHHTDLRHTDWQLHCPYCQHRFLQDDSPQIEE